MSDTSPEQEPNRKRQSEAEKLRRQQDPEYAERRREACRKWRANHKDTQAAACRKWADKNLDHLAEYARQRRAEKKANDPEWVQREYEIKRRYRIKNWEYIKALNRKWVKAHPEYRQRKNHRSREIWESVLVKDLTDEQWEDIKAAYDNHCAYCGVHCDKPTMDHITPLSKGGDHTAANVVPCCGSCNSRKADATNWVPLMPEQILGHSTKPLE